jgi:hypothetical protein
LKSFNRWRIITLFGISTWISVSQILRWSSGTNHTKKWYWKVPGFDHLVSERDPQFAGYRVSHETLASASLSTGLGISS